MPLGLSLFHSKLHEFSPFLTKSPETREMAFWSFKRRVLYRQPFKSREQFQNWKWAIELTHLSRTFVSDKWGFPETTNVSLCVISTALEQKQNTHILQESHAIISILLHKSFISDRESSTSWTEFPSLTSTSKKSRNEETWQGSVVSQVKRKRIPSW